MQMTLLSDREGFCLQPELQQKIFPAKTQIRKGFPVGWLSSAPSDHYLHKLFKQSDGQKPSDFGLLSCFWRSRISNFHFNAGKLIESPNPILRS
jgi:hypothetical protein